jgi:hypothetical protein
MAIESTPPPRTRISVEFSANALQDPKRDLSFGENLGAIVPSVNKEN